MSFALILCLAPIAPVPANESFPKLEILDSIDMPREGNGEAIGELSGLGWDYAKQLLYAVSDRGLIHHFNVRLEGSRIAELKPVFSGRLTSPGAQRGPVNAEGLDVITGGESNRPESELLIALEDGPAIARFTPQGQFIASMKLPGPLGDKNSYNDDKERLEAVAAHPSHGFLTAPERPLLGPSRDHHTIFAANGQTWSFKTFQPKRSSLKAIEVTSGGGLLVLERTRDEKGGEPSARLRYVDLAKCSGKEPCPVADPTVASGEGPLGNYEGLTRIADDLYLMVSDHKKRDPEPAKLVLFRFRAGR